MDDVEQERKAHEADIVCTAVRLTRLYDACVMHAAGHEIESLPIDVGF